MPKQEELVSNAPLREAFENSGMRAYDLAIAIDWRKGPKRKPDTQRVQRVLGLAPYYNSYNSRKAFAKSLTIDNAIKIGSVLNLDPVDIGV